MAVDTSVPLVPTVIALCSLAVSVAAVVLARPARKLQRAQLLRETHADVAVTLDADDKHFIATNSGGAVAYEVGLGVNEKNGHHPLPPQEAAERLPIMELQPGACVALIASVSRDCMPPFDGVVSCREADCTEKHKRLRIDREA